MEQIEAIFFDWGGVLIEDPAPGLMAHCAAALDVSVQDYTRAHAEQGEAFQKGQIVEEAFWERVCGALDRPLPRVGSLWGEAFRAVYAPRAEVFVLAQRLHEHGLKTALLSNTEVPAMAFFLELRYAMFDALVFSCAEGTFKPERQIYEVAARKVKAPPERCILIDDKPAFVEGARQAGMKGIVYQTLAQVRGELATLGVRM